MSIAHHMLFARGTVMALLAVVFTIGLAGCSSETALTDSYKIEYIPGDMPAMVGKTNFKISVTDLSNNAAVTGAMVTLKPLMRMPDRTHSTPIDGPCVESNTAGSYDCTVYYLMASEMNGVALGDWDLEVMVDDGSVSESAHFYPMVMMAMADTARADLKGVDDQVLNMTGAMEDRRYMLFKSSLTGMTDNHNYQLFIASTETMMSFPALTDGLVLNAGESYELTADTIVVQMSTDKSTWVEATDEGNGYWAATGLSGLTDGVEAEIYVSLSVSGEQKTTNGELDNGMTDETANGYATFTVTPGSM